MLLYKSGFVDVKTLPKTQAFDFSRNTTYGLGGRASDAYFPRTVLEAKNLYSELNQRGIPFKIIGNGSNLLVSDSGFDGSVICTKHMQGIVQVGNDRLLCLSGTKISQLLYYCKKHRLSGAEYLYGIPATVGGAAFMNAGVNGAAIGDNIESVKIFDGKIRKLSHEMCNFGYRQSTMRDINCVILSIMLKLENKSEEEIEEKINFYRNRRAHLPKGKSCGCVFKNPNGCSAGYLIEACGLKGARFGGAEVGKEHANFIINDGGTARDVKTLIGIIKDSVFNKFGILLEEEVVYIGDFYGSDG